MLFDYSIRSASVSPPLGYLGGFPYFILGQSIMQFGHFVLLNFYGISGLAAYIAISIAYIYLDGFVSNSFGQNILNLRKNGFYDWFTAITILFNLTSSQGISLFFIHYLCGPQVVLKFFGWENYNLAVFAKVLINISITEYLFFLAHRALHQYWPRIHAMHHCCKKATSATNLIFHPVDLMLEFAGPAFSLLFLHFTVWKQDTFVLFLSYLFVQTYYAIDHNEWWPTYHYTHHSYVDSVYTIYIKHRSNPARDCVKSILK
jgi:sterol desaturase/sphingolipid hydroxylase (fatty acid hydroxylase superfamily)